MCKVLFTKDGCCFSCRAKYIPFGRAGDYKSMTDQEATSHVTQMDFLYANPPEALRHLVEKVNNGK